MCDGLNRLMERCKGAVYLEINPHRSAYRDVMEYIKEDYPDDEAPPGVEDGGTLVVLQFYPATSIGFHLVIDSDLDRAIVRALDFLEQEKGD